MQLKNPTIGPIIRGKSQTSVSIVIHGNKIHKYGYVRIFNMFYDQTISLELNKNTYYGHRFTFNNLMPNTTYSYQAGLSRTYYPSTTSLGTEVHSFTTLSADKYTVALGSCRFYSNVLGLFSVGRHISDKAFVSLNKQDVDSMYIVGDHPYMDSIKELSFIRLKSRRAIFKNHRAVRSTKGFAKLAAKIDIQEVPDDHEYRDNGTPEKGAKEPKVYRNAIDGINVFQIHSGPHEYGSDVKYWKYEDKGICDTFICDTRYERTPGKIISDEQMSALQNALLNKSDKKPFLIFTPVPFLLAQHGDDMWYGFPNQQIDLLDYIQEYNIRNVFFLTGDSHVSVSTDFNFYYENQATGNRIVEIMSSPLFQIAYDSRKSIQNTYVIDTDLYLQSSTALSKLRAEVIRENNYAIIEVLDDMLTVTYYKSSNGAEITSTSYLYW